MTRWLAVAMLVSACAKQPPEQVTLAGRDAPEAEKPREVSLAAVAQACRRWLPAEGRVEIEATFDRRGQVSEARIVRSTVDETRLEQCVLQEVQGVGVGRLPDPVTTRLPFVFGSPDGS